MKKALILLLFTLTAFMPQEKFSLVGRWKAVGGTVTYIMELDKDGYATLIRNGKSMGGKEYSMGKEKASVTYEADLTKTPHTLSFTLHRHSTKDDVPMYTVYFKSINNNEIITVVSEGKTPDFTSKEAVVYKRQ